MQTNVLKISVAVMPFSDLSPGDTFVAVSGKAEFGRYHGDQVFIKTDRPNEVYGHNAINVLDGMWSAFQEDFEVYRVYPAGGCVKFYIESED